MTYDGLSLSPPAVCVSVSLCFLQQEGACFSSFSFFFFFEKNSNTNTFAPTQVIQIYIMNFMPKSMPEDLPLLPKCVQLQPNETLQLWKSRKNVVYVLIIAIVGFFSFTNYWDRPIVLSSSYSKSSYRLSHKANSDIYTVSAADFSGDIR
jgi:hypothetical protein